MPKSIWGLDLSKYAIKGVRLSKTPGGFVLDRVDIYNYNKMQVDQAQMYDLLAGALTVFKKNNKIGRQPVVLSLPIHSTFNRIIKIFIPVEDSKFPEIVKGEAQNNIPFPLSEVIWDYQKVIRDYEPDEGKEVLIFAIRKDLVEEFLNTVGKAGLNIAAIQFAPVALYNFITYDQDTGGACLVLDMGADNTDLVIIEDSKFWVRNLPVTGATFTKALQEKFNLSFEDAERYKIAAPRSPQAQKLYLAMQGTYRDLLNEVQRSVGYYKSLSKQLKLTKVFMLGNGSKAINLPTFFSQGLGLPVSKLNQLNRIQVSDEINQTMLYNNLSSLGTAIGLGIQGHKLSKNQVNLLPITYIQKVETRKKQPVVAFALILLGVLVLMFSANLSSQIDKRKDAINDIKMTLTEINKKNITVKKEKDMSQQIKVAETLFSYSLARRDILPKVLNKIIPNLPDNHNPNLPLHQKLWIVDLECKEVIQESETATGGRIKKYHLLIISIECAISMLNKKGQERSSEEQTKFVRKKLGIDRIEKSKEFNLKGNIEVSTAGSSPILLPSDPTLPYHIEYPRPEDMEGMPQKYFKVKVIINIILSEQEVEKKKVRRFR
jgi:type IV pilus assembly protein PilM